MSRVMCDGDDDINSKNASHDDNDQTHVARAARLVRNGGVIIFPTDTVYGIGCDPYNTKAVGRIYSIKSRDISKPVPILIDSVETAQSIAVMDNTSMRMARRFWPGPLTIILDVSDKRLAESLHLNDLQGIALRIPAHPCTRQLLDTCKMIVGTSANPSGTKPTGDPAVCMNTMSGYDMILDGGIIPNPAESTIIDARSGRIAVIREGGKLKLEEILEES